MPDVIRQFAKTGDIRECQNRLSDLVCTFRDDFSKYKKRVPVSRLNDVFESIVFQTGSKFKYSKACPDARTDSIKSALDLLVLAGLAYQFPHSDARGLPLGAQTDSKRFKTVLLDVGLHQQRLGLDLTSMLVAEDFHVVNRGAMAEVFAAQELRMGRTSRSPRDLYYWHREAKNSNAEVDYIIQHGAEVLPIEVKSGGSGSMQSIRLFMKERKIKKGIRTSLENFGEVDNIDIVPLYALGNHINSEA